MENPDEWTGTYFKGVPVRLKAVPSEGYKFSGWAGVDGVLQTSDKISFVPGEDMSVTALYELVPVKPSVYGDLDGDKKVNYKYYK